MAKRYVLGLMAANRTGILAAVAKALEELGGDIQEVSLTVMQRFFTIILAADFPDHRDAQVIISHLEGVCRPFGVDVILKDPQTEALQQEPTQGFDKYYLTLTGRDAPGIVARISGRLAREHIDITDLYGLRRDEDQHFVMILELAVPAGVDAAALRGELEKLGAPIGLSATLEHESAFASANDLRPARTRAGRRLPPLA
ncbi:MAG: glycine cleavage system protein R [Planctomycetaceae bacterium]